MLICPEFARRLAAVVRSASPPGDGYGIDCP